MAGKTEKTEIEFEGWKLVRTDPLNYRLYRFAEKKKGENKGEAGWVAQPNYFGTLHDGVVFARNRTFDMGGFTGNLDEAIVELERLDARFLKAVREAVGE